MSDKALELVNVHRTYIQGARKLEVLKGVNLEVKKGQMVALVGPSGCGKSTLLHIAGLLEKPDIGNVYINHQDTAEFSDKRRNRLRNQSIGYVFQFHHLLPEFTAVENVAFPLMIGGHARTQAKKAAADLLVKVGLEERLRHRPSELSGGEQQRVAIARAVIQKPSIILADEPTGNLDPETANIVFGLFQKMAEEHGCATLLVTHNTGLAAQADQIFTLEDGKVMLKGNIADEEEGSNTVFDLSGMYPIKI